MDQMLTAEVGLKAMVWGVSAGMEGEDPSVCTEAGLGWEDNAPFEDAAQAGSRSPLGRGGGNHLSVLAPLLPPKWEEEDGLSPHCLFTILFPLPQSAFLLGHLQGQIWRGPALFSWSSQAIPGSHVPLVVLLGLVQSPESA